MIMLTVLSLNDYCDNDDNVVYDYFIDSNYDVFYDDHNDDGDDFSNNLLILPARP